MKVFHGITSKNVVDSIFSVFVPSEVILTRELPPKGRPRK
jgi:hypothetical protein